MSESKFCKTLGKLKRDEMDNFVVAIEQGDKDRASRLLESIGFMDEVSDSICELKGRRKKD